MFHKMLHFKKKLYIFLSLLFLIHHSLTLHFTVFLPQPPCPHPQFTNPLPHPQFTKPLPPVHKPPFQFTTPPPPSLPPPPPQFINPPIYLPPSQLNPQHTTTHQLTSPHPQFTPSHHLPPPSSLPCFFRWGGVRKLQGVRGWPV